jgi:hypothetical protein
MRARALLILFTLLLVSAPLSAGIVFWTVTGAGFEDGGILTGSFGYDADLNSFSSISLTTTDGSIRTGAEFVQFLVCCGSGPQRLLFITNATGDLTGTPVLGIDLVAPMTSAGGTIKFDLGVVHAEMACMTASCIGGTDPTRELTSGAITSTTPEPGTLLLVGPVAVLPLWRRRRLSKQVL